MMKGIISYYNREKNFGFIGGAESIFVHGTYRVTPLFDGSDKPNISRGRLDNNAARKMDSVLFESERVKRGLRAKWWCFSQEYDKVVVEIEARPTYMFRVHFGPVKIGRLTPVGYEPPRMFWMGKDLSNIKGSTYTPCKTYHCRKWYEMLTEEGWVVCDDPRPKENELWLSAKTSLVAVTNTAAAQTSTLRGGNST